MVQMDGEDPNPIPTGTKGVVTKIDSQVFSGIPEEHLSINWENGRTLKVLLPHDKIKIIKNTFYDIRLFMKNMTIHVFKNNY